MSGYSNWSLNASLAGVWAKMKALEGGSSDYLSLSTGGTVRAEVKAVSFTSYGEASQLTDAGLTTPNVITSSLTLNGTQFNPSSYLTTTAASNTYLPISNGTVNAVLAYNAVGSVFRGILLNWSGVSLWKIGSDTAQTGSNNGGGDLHHYAYGDDGSFLGDTAAVSRTARVWNFINSPNVPTPPTTDNSTKVASTAMVQAAATAAAATRAAVNLTGSPWYAHSPYLRNAQLATGFGTVLFSFIAPRAMTLTGASGYADTLSAAAIPVYVSPTSPGTGPVAQLGFFNNLNKATFSWVSGTSLVLAAGDRVYVTMGAASNGVGSMDGVSITLIFTLN